MITALYLAHLNPVTRAHVQIIKELQQQADRVKVMPVIFKNRTEVNSRSFPFTFAQRKKMLESVFQDAVHITPDYTFTAPFWTYFPPLISPRSWALRKSILNEVDGKYFTYTGDKTEGYMLKLYMLRPRVGMRKPLSATSVKSELYRDAVGLDSNWEAGVPKPVSDIIRQEWSTVERFARTEDNTSRILGMKFPKIQY